MGIWIRGLGAYIPENRVNNHQIASAIDTSDRWITQKTGILERRISSPEMATSDLALKAAENCLENAGINAEELDLIIVATSSPDQIQPAVACLVQEKLGISATHCPAFDVNSVCAGFVFAMHTGQGMMLSEPEQYRNVMVIGAETYSKILNWQDRKTCVFFGDGAGAVLLSHSEHRKGHIRFRLGSDGRGSSLIGIPAGGSRQPVNQSVLEQNLNKFTMDGRKVWEFATTLVAPAIRQLAERHGISVRDLDLVILHQANLRMIEQIMEQLELPMEKTVTTVQHYGNTAAASIPITLKKAFDEGRLFPGARVALCGFGGGLSWGTALLEW